MASDEVDGPAPGLKWETPAAAPATTNGPAPGLTWESAPNVLAFSRRGGMSNPAMQSAPDAPAEPDVVTLGELRDNPKAAIQRIGAIIGKDAMDPNLWMTMVASYFGPKLFTMAAPIVGKAAAGAMRMAPEVVRSGATAAGAYVGGPAGAVVGRTVGEAVAGRMRPPVPEGPVSSPGYPRSGSTPAPPPAPVEPPAHLDLSQRVPAGGLTQQQIAERLAATKAQGMTAPKVEPVMAPRPSPSSVPVPAGPPEPSIEAAKPAAPSKSPQQILNEEAIAKRRAAYQESLKADAKPVLEDLEAGKMTAEQAAAELAKRWGTPSDAERRFPPNKSGLPSNPPTARKARGKVSDLADMPMKAVLPGAALGAGTVAALAGGSATSDTKSSESPWTKAQTIGAPKVGEHYALPSLNEIMSSDNPLGRLLEHVTGPARPSSVAAQDPFGLLAMEQGKGPVPGMLGTTEEVGGKALGTLAKTLQKTGTKGEYVLKPEVIERLKSFLKIGQDASKGSNWAGAESKELIAAFGGDKAKALQWARMWGATSPNTSVPVNTREAVSALAHVLENPGVTLTAEQARLLPDAKITMAGSKVPNLNRAIAGQPLSGDKVEAMSAFMAGEPRIPIDVHALYGLGTKGDKLSPELSALRTYMTKAEKLPARGGLTDTDLYMRYEKALKSALESIAPDKSVNETFATLWEGVRTQKGLKPQGGPIDILRKKGLLEFGAMLEPERLRSALRSAGWTASAIAGLMAAMPSRGGKLSDLADVKSEATD